MSDTQDFDISMLDDPNFIHQDSTVEKEDSAPLIGTSDRMTFTPEKANETTFDEVEVPPQKKQPQKAPVKPASITEKIQGDIHKANLSLREFPPVPKLLEEKPNDIFDDKTYYKTCLTGENDFSKRLHEMLTKYLKATDPADKTVFRQNVTSAYWECIKGMVAKMALKSTPMPKRMMIRFGVLLPSLFRPEQKEFFSRIIFDNPYKEPVLYMDEWFREIASGRMSCSATDEKNVQRASTPEEQASQEQARLQQLQSKNSGRMQSAENIVTMKEHERENLERETRSRLEDLFIHEPISGLEPHCEPYTESQQKLLTDIMDRLRSLSRNNKELSKALAEFRDSKSTYETVEDKLTENPAELAANATSVGVEFGTVRQMAKMTVGRQGNQYPIFTRDFYHCTEKGTGTRENVIEILRWIEGIDPGAFCRIHKNVSNRIVPYVLLIPTYGDRGFCWEPFDRYNRTTSRARIVVPMYPRDLRTAVIVAVADLRWQVAKEKASYYWMEEGLTGQYYQHIDRLKLKGDLKAFFIEDYILWMTKESEGVQRLDKEVRGIFWRNMPFPQEKKEILRKRSLVYEDLCQKDANRAMSDGY